MFVDGNRIALKRCIGGISSEPASFIAESELSKSGSSLFDVERAFDDHRGLLELLRGRLDGCGGINPVLFTVALHPSCRLLPPTQYCRVGSVR
jgi:hypothetical protein